MRGAHVVPPLGAQQFSDRSPDRDRIPGRLHAAERDMALAVGDELAAQVHIGLRRILVLVEAFRRRLPDVDFGPGNGPAGSVPEPCLDEQRRAGCRRPHDRAAVGRRRRMHAPERTEQARVGLGLTVVAVVEQAHERGQAERARDQHRLVMGLGRVPAELHDVAGRGSEFLLGQPHLAGEIVQMPHERTHDLPETVIRRSCKLAQHGGGDVLLPVDDHLAGPEWENPWPGALRNRPGLRGPQVIITWGRVVSIRRRAPCTTGGNCPAFSGPLASCPHTGYMTALWRPCSRRRLPTADPTASAEAARSLHAPVAQLDRAPDYKSGGRGFESCPVRQYFQAFRDFRPSDQTA